MKVDGVGLDIVTFIQIVAMYVAIGGAVYLVFEPKLLRRFWHWLRGRH